MDKRNIAEASAPEVVIYRDSSAPEVVFNSIANEGLQVAEEHHPRNHRHIAPNDSHKIERRPRSSKERRRNPFGLGALAFGALVSLITALIVGGAVGGAVGLSLSPQHSTKSTTCSTSIFSSVTTVTSINHLSTASPTAQLTNYAPAAPTNVATLALPCPSQDNSNHSTLHGDIFSYQCDYDYNGGDYMGITAYTISDCFLACSNLNYWIGNTTCLGVTMGGRLALSIAQQDANCWLKKSLTENPIVNKSLVQMSAVLR